MQRFEAHNPRSFPPDLLMFVALVMSAALAGCAGHTRSPETTVETYVNAVQDKDAGKVYALLDDTMRMGLTEEAFSRWFLEHHEMILEQAQRIYARAESFEVKAELPLPRGHVARLVFEDGGWRLTHREMSRGPERSPRETLTAFSDALERGDFETILRLLSAVRRTAYLDELEALQEQLRAASGSAIVSKGAEAILPLPGGGRVVFVREHGAWKIQAFEQSNNNK